MSSAGDYATERDELQAKIDAIEAWLDWYNDEQGEWSDAADAVYRILHPEIP